MLALSLADANITALADKTEGWIAGLQQGEIFGFLGPNGTGKTTTLSILEAQF